MVEYAGAWSGLGGRANIREVDSTLAKRVGLMMREEYEAGTGLTGDAERCDSGFGKTRRGWLETLRLLGFEELSYQPELLSIHGREIASLLPNLSSATPRPLLFCQRDFLNHRFQFASLPSPRRCFPLD